QNKIAARNERRIRFTGGQPSLSTTGPGSVQLPPGPGLRLERVTIRGKNCLLRWRTLVGPSLPIVAFYLSTTTFGAADDLRRSVNGQSGDGRKARFRR